MVEMQEDIVPMTTGAETEPELSDIPGIDIDISTFDFNMHG